MSQKHKRASVKSGESWMDSVSSSLSSALDSVADADYEDVQGALSKVTGGHPLGAAAATGLATGGLGYALGPKLISKLHGGISQTMGRFGGNAPSQAFRSPEEYRSAQRRMGVLGALAGAAPWAPVIWNHYKDEKSASYEGDDDLYSLCDEIRNLQESVCAPSGRLQGPRKEANENYIDSSFAKSIVQRDPHIPQQDTDKLTNIFDEAERRSGSRGKLQGMVTSGDLIRGATGAGLGYATASVAGPVLGSVFGLPRGTQELMKRTGGLAGALKGSGILQ